MSGVKSIGGHFSIGRCTLGHDRHVFIWETLQKKRTRVCRKKMLSTLASLGSTRHLQNGRGQAMRSEASGPAVADRQSFFGKWKCCYGRAPRNPRRPAPSGPDVARVSASSAALNDVNTCNEASTAQRQRGRMLRGKAYRSGCRRRTSQLWRTTHRRPKLPRPQQASTAWLRRRRHGCATCAETWMRRRRKRRIAECGPRLPYPLYTYIDLNICYQ